MPNSGGNPKKQFSEVLLKKSGLQILSKQFLGQIPKPRIWSSSNQRLLEVMATQTSVRLIEPQEVWAIIQQIGMHLKVASLNFSATNVSPFEYFDGSLQKITLNSCFLKLLKGSSNQTPKDLCKLARIDKTFQKARYTILYRPDVGVVRGKLVNIQQFDAIWDLTFDMNLTGATHDEESIEMLKRFDLMMYQAFVETVFGQVEWSRIKQYDSGKYLQELKKWHSKCYLKSDFKVKSLCDYLVHRDIDILFVQEAQVEEIAASLPESYLYSQTAESMIILKKSFFLEHPEASNFTAKFGELLNFNKDSAFVKLRDYLLISAHLSSKKVKKQQFESMREIIRKILVQEPHLKIIMGVDANQFITDFPQLNVYPATSYNFTTRKRRTDMQLQFEKSGIIVEDVKDHILTNFDITESYVETVTCKAPGAELLPCQNHPYDHFVVGAVLYHRDFTLVKDVQLLKPPSLSKNMMGDCGSISTNNSVNQSKQPGQTVPVDSSWYKGTPSIIVSHCDSQKQRDRDTDLVVRFGVSQDLCKSSNSRFSSKQHPVSQPTKGVLRFRETSHHPRPNKCSMQLLKIEERNSLDFRQSSNRSRSVRKSIQKSFPSKIMLTFNRDGQDYSLHNHAGFPGIKAHNFKHRKV